MSERVTLLLPVKNGMPYLTETLASIAAQTYPNWEVLAWDNGSTDGTVEELKRWIPERVPGRVISDEPLPLGLSRARLVESAHTELCACIDADDINHPERLQRQVDFLRERPKVGMVGCDVEYVNADGSPRGETTKLPGEDAEIRWRLRWDNSFCQPTVLFRRSVVIAAGNYRNCKPIEDYDLWFRVAAQTDVANIQFPLVKYRLHEGSVTAGWKQDDYDQLSEQAARNHPAMLFGSFDAADALTLRSKVARNSNAQVRLLDLITLRRAATSTALSLGKSADYFRSTVLYAQQQRRLRQRWLHQNIWAHTGVRLFRRLQANLSKAI